MSVETKQLPRPRLLGELRSMRAFLYLHWDYTKRYLAWDIVWLVSDLVSAMTIGLIGISSGAQPKFLGGESFLAYLLVGAIMWSYLSVIFYIIAETIGMERWEGTLEYTFMAPVSRVTHLTGVAVVGVIYSLLRTAIIVAALYWGFHITVPHANYAAAAVVLLVGSVAIIGLAVIAAVMPLLSPEKGSQAVHIVSSIILLVSGVYYPLSVLPAWLRPLAQVNPAYWTLEGLRGALLDGRGLGQLGHELVWLALSGLLFLPVGFVVFALAERYAKRTGLLKRVG